jgi:hypothetical protein
LVFGLLVVASLVAASATAWATAWWLRRRHPAIRVGGAVVVGLGTACLIWVSTVGLFLASLFEVWPFSLRQGPDTAFSRECYEEFLGGPPPPHVTAVYCRREWGFGGDDVYTLRFTFRERSTVQQVVERLQLEPVPESERGGRYLSGPEWWPSRDQLWRLGDVYRRKDTVHLWIDYEAMEAFYQEANF